MPVVRKIQHQPVKTMKSTLIAIPAIVATALFANASTIALTNADFETGPFGNTQSITGWDEFEVTGAASGGGDDNYNESRPANINSHVLHLKADGGNWVGQNMTVSDTGTVDATTYPNYTVEFDYGYRADTNTNHGHGDITVRIGLWNTTANTEMAGYDLLIPDPNQRVNPVEWTATDYRVNLTYDNTAQTSGDTIQVRFTQVSPDLASSTYLATAMFDNVSVTAVPEPSSVFLLGALGLLGFLHRRRS
jgi:hypothetical protein